MREEGLEGGGPGTYERPNNNSTSDLIFSHRGPSGSLPQHRVRGRPSLISRSFSGAYYCFIIEIVQVTNVNKTISKGPFNKQKGNETNFISGQVKPRIFGEQGLGAGGFES